MTSSITANSPKWLELARRSVSAMNELFAQYPRREDRTETVGVGEGGDHTLIIDQLCEEIVFSELEQLFQTGATFTALSEERGKVSYGADYPLIVIDPIDGSLNAKRGITHHSLAIAVASGPTAADVEFGFVFDFGPQEEWVAFKGEGVLLNREPLSAEQELIDSTGRLEVLAIESADPRWIAHSAGALAEVAYRIRAIGSIAITMCQVAAGRFDGMLSLRSCRSVDSVAAALIVAESGGSVAFPNFTPPLSVPLDLVAHSPVVAARTSNSVERLSEVLRAQPN